MTPHADVAARVPEGAAPEHPNQFALLGQRRFAPFFWTQFLGAGNDNLFKFAFTVLITYQLQVAWLPPTLAGLVIGALFILPFLLFSATSGQLADKFEKARLIRFVKWLEIAVMALAAWGFVRADVVVLLACVFLMGLHSTLFGPVKFAYLPQHLNERELTGGNGMVEMGTFVAILLGNVAGGLLISLPGGAKVVAVACIAVAVLGRLTAQAVPTSPSTDPGLVINWNPVSETWRNLKLAHGNLVVFRSLLGISWMWFFGAAFLAQFPAFAKEVLHGDEQVASLLLVVFSVGIGIGSLLCEILVAPPRRDRPGAVRRDRHERVLGRSLLRGARAAAVGRLHAVRVPRRGPPLARDGRPRAAVALRRPLQRADVRADPDALAPQPPGADHRRQQHPERALHDRQRGDRRRAARAPASRSRRSS